MRLSLQSRRTPGSLDVSFFCVLRYSPRGAQGARKGAPLGEGGERGGL